MGDDIPPANMNHATKAGCFSAIRGSRARRVYARAYDKDPLPNNITDPQVYFDAHAADLGHDVLYRKQFPASTGRHLLGQTRLVNRTKPIGARVMFTSLKATHGRQDRGLRRRLGSTQHRLVPWRPVDVAVMKDGSLLVSDDFAGALYRITYSAP